MPLLLVGFWNAMPLGFTEFVDLYSWSFVGASSGAEVR